MTNDDFNLQHPRTGDGKFASKDSPETLDGTNALSHTMATLTETDFLTDDELEFARETLGSNAAESDVEELAWQRAHDAYNEYIVELDERFPVGNPLPTCDRHGGQWGDDLTCEDCCDDDGNMRPFDQN